MTLQDLRNQNKMKYSKLEKNAHTQNKEKKNKHLGYIFVFCFHGQLSIHHHQRINVKNSSRVFGLSRNSPNIQLVIVLLLIFCTPRIIIHICLLFFFKEKKRKERIYPKFSSGS